MSAAVASLKEVQQQQLNANSVSSSTAGSSSNADNQSAMEEEDKKQPAGAAKSGNASAPKLELVAAHQQDGQPLQQHHNHDALHNLNIEPDPIEHDVVKKMEGRPMALAGQTRAATIEDDEDGDGPSILPPPLYQILSEVAKTGQSSTLTWKSVKKGHAQEAAASSLSKKRSLLTAQTSRDHANTVAPVALRPRAVASILTTNSSGINPKVAAAAAPPRKKHRNGLHGHRKSRSNNRKRPLHLIRTGGSSGGGTTTASGSLTTTTTVSAPTVASAVAARFGTSASGSEADDASQYDSEGTSTTSTSEFSADQQHWQVRQRSSQQQHLTLRTIHASSSIKSANMAQGGNTHLYTSSLREAFKTAVELVLNSWFEQKRGYKLSPAEAKIHNGKSAAKEIFNQRKQRLIHRLEAPRSDSTDDGPPFTIQRIAEVLVAPNKYYTQTHKLFNCLEKLLLVSSSISSFGGSRGGVTSQSRKEEQELAALADERDRIQSEFRQLRRRRSSLASDAGGEHGLGIDVGNTRVDGNDDVSHLQSIDQNKGGTGFLGNEKVTDAEVAAATGCNPAEDERRELEAAARASLRSKFDHVGIDPHNPHHGAIANANATESRSLTNSPPPPSLASAPNLSGGLLRSPHATHGDPSSPVRSPSPILFNEVGSPSTSPQSLANTNPNMHVLQIHHAAAVAGVSPFDLMTIGTAAGTSMASAGSALLGTTINGLKEQDLESRSSASSDVDSESDDVSFDDSASDRSDGSDSGYVGTSAAAEAGAGASGTSNFSALAQAMALKRHQTRTAAVSRSTTAKLPGTEPSTAAPETSGAVAAPASNEEVVREDSDVSDSSLSSDMAD
mmetsp:Transcript_11393/g.23349  ORF Transcript_11393/g.23349 Transcript_11393/m.23349 type:complete len:844 (-) Transcript_11393:769-3300(-)|eukprot:CAMPEP_0172445844 /NCGR_PEP_ID=MMETSP1065-20121228/5630_1 /TAXON_ID=265537 /ORGANISM="Amphiprora paludosa, Strain CCMP125" /LENGTH=843 /DNA_ID=CAMNT_0013196851 /DNA_START=285 /DNA_END=2816 /DNA_ORIENTATION=-